MPVVEEVHLNDIGTVFRQTVYDCSTVLDVSGASDIELIFRKPNKTLLTVVAALTTDGTDGQIQYTSASGDLDQLGEWQIQPRVQFASNQWFGNVNKFRVYKNLVG